MGFQGVDAEDGCKGHRETFIWKGSRGTKKHPTDTLSIEHSLSHTNRLSSLDAYCNTAILTEYQVNERKARERNFGKREYSAKSVKIIHGKNIKCRRYK